MAKAREGQHGDLNLQYDDGETGEDEDGRKTDDDNNKNMGITLTKPYQSQNEDPDRLQTCRKRIVYSDDDEEIEAGLVTNRSVMVDQSIKQKKQKREFLWPRIGGGP